MTRWKHTQMEAHPEHKVGQGLQGPGLEEVGVGEPFPLLCPHGRREFLAHEYDTDTDLCGFFDEDVSVEYLQPSLHGYILIRYADQWLLQHRNLLLKDAWSVNMSAWCLIKIQKVHKLLSSDRRWRGLLRGRGRLLHLLLLGLRCLRSVSAISSLGGLRRRGRGLFGLLRLQGTGDVRDGSTP